MVNPDMSITFDPIDVFGTYYYVTMQLVSKTELIWALNEIRQK